MIKEHVFDFLDNLRASGIVNMFGAGPYVEDVFECTRSEARDLVIEWMETFSERHSNEQKN